jgi:hypothetical protein
MEVGMSRRCLTHQTSICNSLWLAQNGGTRLARQRRFVQIRECLKAAGIRARVAGEDINQNGGGA